MKHYIKLALSAIITCSIGYAENLKICQSQEDKIQGCLERIYTGAALIPYQYGAFMRTACDCAYEFPYKNGKIEGIAKAYSDKKLVGTYPYKNGKLDGIAKWYYENGNLRIETPHKDGKKDGVRKLYYENGNLDQETPYKNGKEDGIEKGYDENGNLERETPYKDGKQDGVEKWYYENGDLIAEITYKNEKIISGKCGDGKAFSNAHLHNLEKHYDIDFIIKKICEKP
ncbi:MULTISPECIES: toxin-antitoxin system YwqK family antitoxin [Helicobacter]|uniref:MORN repeat variant n=1 Tax=Helicobacter bilis ATCC 43879 TaxID=613026 RepID=C3XHP6_9HELI|nr:MULTISPECIES: toxin-antitoxin system YwqK family antitoxin [Helicobacter]EEO24535.1 hypothetical protein HRAG_01592 [Helicobacter bilis ATCC 43879]